MLIGWALLWTAGDGGTVVEGDGASTIHMR